MQRLKNVTVREHPLNDLVNYKQKQPKTLTLKGNDRVPPAADLENLYKMQNLLGELGNLMENNVNQDPGSQL